MNFGHTFGHAIESFTGFSKKIFHGEAVILGMYLALKFSNYLGLCDTNLINKFCIHLNELKIPYKLRDYKIKISPLNFLKHIKFDKKIKNNKMKFILLQDFAKPVAYVVKDENILNNFLKKKPFLINMDLPLHILIGSIIGLVILSAFFSGSETSLTSASKPRMHNLAKSGKKNAKIFETLFKDKELLICTILFANNLVNVLASALATKILIELTNTDGIFYATIIMTLMILIFGELIPKTLALSKSDTYALKISPFIRFLVILLYPLTVTLNFIVYVLLKIVGVNYSNFKKEEISEKREEELRGAIDLHGEDSSRDEKNMLKSILDLDEITVGSIMIPRKDIFSLPANINFNNLIEKLDESPHSRIPIWEKNPENIIGVFHVRRLISLKNPDPKKFNIKLLCQKPWFIPESTKLDNQLMEFKKRKEHFSIVVDEYGEFLGIVTLEDIIEEIVGDIDDEQDMLKISKKVKGIKSLSPSNFLVKGNVSIRDLNKELNINLPINNNVSTIAGLVLYESRTIPKTKQIFSFFDLKFEILNKTNNQITLLKISKKKD